MTESSRSTIRRFWTSIGAAITRLAANRPSCRTIRVRLTVTYGLLFLLVGLVMIAVTFVLMEHSTGRIIVERFGPGEHLKRIIPPGAAVANARRQRDTDLEQFLIQSGIALLIGAALALGLGWLLAGRTLRPLRQMTAKARRISQHNLHERLGVPGPSDEVTSLGATIDDLLSRLERAFEGQRRFVANASHELRTPLTWDRTLIEVTLANPHADPSTLRDGYKELLASNEEQERLIEALLTLAESEGGLERKTKLDLLDIVDDTAFQREPFARKHDVKLRTELSHAEILGNSDLIKRLAGNLLDNALQHNHAGGEVTLTTVTRDDIAVLRVSNTGDTIPPESVDRLTEPFHRLTNVRTARATGWGLGLSIVRAVADAHGASLDLRPRDGGGLIVEIRFPSASASS